MARITDQNKIERLKQATMKLVVEYGFGGATVALIAKDAGVASGYFYLHYSSKYEMVNSILQEVYSEVFGRFDEFIQQDLSFFEIIDNMVRYFVKIANHEAIKVKFLGALTNDYNFVIEDELRENTFELIGKLKEIGLKTKSLDSSINDEDLYLILFITTIQFMNQRYKIKKEDVQITEEDIKHLLYLFNKFLR